MKFERSCIDHSSTLFVYSPLFHARLEISGRRLNKKHRRTVMLAALRALKPVLTEHTPATFTHTDEDPWSRITRELRGGASLHQAADATHAPLGYKIRTLRTRVGLTQKELAHRIGLSRTVISMVERGRRMPGPRTLHLIEQGLGTELAALADMDHAGADNDTLNG